MVAEVATRAGGAAVMPLRTEADLDRLLAQAGAQPVLIFKHSTQCPISAAAYRAFHAAVASGDLGAVGPAMVRVVEERPVSQAVAARLGVRHESPQALLVRDGRVLWQASHYAITRDALRAAAREAAGPPA